MSGKEKEIIFWKEFLAFRDIFQEEYFWIIVNGQKIEVNNH